MKNGIEQCVQWSSSGFEFFHQKELEIFLNELLFSQTLAE